MSTNARLLVPKHRDYYWEVYSIGGYNPPCYLEFACYEDQTEMVSGHQYFHFDVGNLEAASYIEYDQFENEERHMRYLSQVERLKSGEIDYFVDWLYFIGSNDGGSEVCCQIPNGNTVFDLKGSRGELPYYAVIYVKEERPLMPDVLCEWMKQLSPVLFGDERLYRIPDEAISTREAAENEYRKCGYY